MKQSITLGFVIGLIILGLGIGIASYRFGSKSNHSVAYDPYTATIFSQPRSFPSFVLTDDQKTVFTNSHLQGRWTLMFFGFTHCGGICPTTMAELAEVIRQYSTATEEDKPRVIFVTVDPERDTPQKMRSYLDSFNPHFIGLTGEVTNLEKLRQQLGILALEKETTLGNKLRNPEDTIDHSGTILIINPKGQYVGVFSMPHHADAIVKDLSLLMD
jgi:protein SCO1